MQRMRRRRALPIQKLRLQRVPSLWLLATRGQQSRQHLGMRVPQHMQMAILRPWVRPVHSPKSRLAVKNSQYLTACGSLLMALCLSSFLIFTMSQ